MEELLETASCSLSNVELQVDELTELTLEQGINVWGKNQETLEEQALHELDAFTQQNSKNDIEEGEIVENKKTTALPSLDINNYIKRQEELRKIQEYKKTLQDNNKNKLIADKISKRYKEKQKRKSDEKKVNVEKKAKIEESISEVVEKVNSSGSEYVPSEDSESEYTTSTNVQPKRRKSCIEARLEKVKDDGCLQYFQTRLEEYYKCLESESFEDDDPESLDYYTIKGGLKIPIRIWCNLYTYQQEAVRWLWNVHRQSTGGLLGDEMGLGKTVQVIAFLAGLEYSQVISHGRFKGLGPSIIVCPATVIHQWVKHFHDWAPEFRVVILHQSGSYQGKKSNLIKEIIKNKGIIITTYASILKYKDLLCQYDWHYLILDEGHKIRNPNAKISIAVKKLKTPHRLMLTGSPMQNNLQELWSLFDFTNPRILGDLNTFMEHFNNPIVQGGFLNSTPLQEATALSVARTLKNVISPYLLRRTKDEVQDYISLPSKSEQVLFCSLTEEQRELYKGYLMSDHVGSILGKSSKNWFSENQTRSHVLIAITALRKICNHPDIYLHDAYDEENKDDCLDDDMLGYYKKSGKMIVVSALLKIWKKQKHRVLLFTQSRAMITIFEKFLNQNEYKFLKMDGSTAISSRQTIINKFNEDSSYDIFLLTTRVGGLGVNLTGANRVIIYDPDWNPATDTQARERAWRIGQEKQVTIYRLLSAGTIEEKMYQRQVWKQLLSNKVLLDPKIHKFFKSSNLHDLFSLPEDNAITNPETTNIFHDSRVKLEEQLKEKSNKKKKDDSILFSEDKIQAMKKLAQDIAKSITKSPEPEVKKSSYQIELEEERQKKLEERAKLKTLSAAELLVLNREKDKEKSETVINKVDDCEADISFAKALEYSESNAKIYNDLKGDRNKKIAKLKKESKKHKLKSKQKCLVDNSGKIDGEKIDGLIKSEIKKVSKQNESINKSESQDNYILEKLFNRKGVSGALQHDSVVNSGIKSHGLKVQTEAQLKADKALEALRKSRLNNWRW